MPRASLTEGWGVGVGTGTFTVVKAPRTHALRSTFVPFCMSWGSSECSALVDHAMKGMREAVRLATSGQVHLRFDVALADHGGAFLKVFKASPDVRWHLTCWPHLIRNARQVCPCLPALCMPRVRLS